MDQEIKLKLEALESKVDEIYKSVEKSRKYFLINTWFTILIIVVPAIIAIFAIPAFLSNYMETLNGAGILGQ